MTTTTLPKIGERVRNRNLRNGQMETWEAFTADGEWHFERIEDVGTPWVIYHRPSGIEVREFFGTLKACRKAVASGWAEQMVNASLVSLLLTGREGGCVR